ncbi:MAG: LPS export ABC transporter permease LptG [Pseudomonadota bacterium]|nr:LPS export ABC transporter permease LptG [Pseudomonadota bacterium]
MIRPTQTLGLYLARQFLVGIAIVLGLLAVVMFTVEVIEHLRRASGREDIAFTLVIRMAAMKLPSVLQQLWPFVFMFGAMLSLTRLANSSELVVARSAGVSVWQMLAPLVICAALSGGLIVTVYNPVAALLAARHQQLDATYFKGQTSLITVSTRTGLWLREAEREGQQVIHATAVSGNGSVLNDVTIFIYQAGDRFARRIDADEARLGKGVWRLDNARIAEPDQPRRFLETMDLPTTLTLTQIVDSLAPPESLSFWQLPHFIDLLQRSGFSTLAHRLHWHSLLATPLLLAGMVILGAAFCIRLSRRRGGMGWVFFAGTMSGFAIFFLTDLVQAFGSAGKLPVVLAAWTPAAVTSMSTIAAMFHLEDG